MREWYLTNVFSIVLTFAVVALFWIIRKELVSAQRKKAHYLMSIAGRVSEENWVKANSDQYLLQCWDLRKWTFKDFYPFMGDD